MDYRELLRESFSTLILNKIRTGLAMLGVVIGIGSVIALMSLGQGSQTAIENQIRSLGANLLTVIPGARTTGGVRGAMGATTTLTYLDAKALDEAQLSAIKAVAAEYSQNVQVIAGRQNINTRVAGVTPNYAEVRNLALSSGSFISEVHLAGLSKVAVLGSQAAEDLFGDIAGALGQSLRINGTSFLVIGVVASNGGSGVMSDDDRLYMPLTTAQKIVFGVNHLTTMYVEAVGEEQMTAAQDQVGYFLLGRHKLNTPDQADFMIMSQQDILGTVSEVTGTFTTLLSGIAAISLVVGGIGIMNIMLVTVTERTREIGLRKAIGAQRKVIVTQFLFEAMMITCIGGLIGVLVGMGVSLLISRAMSLPFTISFSSVALAFGVSVAIGILFGWYPAQKAARLAPIDALRYE